MSDYGYEEIHSTAPSGQTVHCCLPLPHPDRQIRVLILDPFSSEHPTLDQELVGRIVVLNELTGNEYAALSYVWDPKPEDDAPHLERQNRLIIQCGDHRHEARIKPNCWSALWHICKIQKPTKTVLWVDSICIDQKNDEEKNHQITLMCNIYKSARKTYFWLGEAAAGTNEAMDFLSSDRITLSAGRIRDTLIIGIKIWWQLARLRPYLHYDGLQHIFRREWIERLWTLQEFLLSREGILVCGEKSVSWKRLVCALESIHYFHDHPWSIFFDNSYIRWRNLAKLLEWLAENGEVPRYDVPENSKHLSSQTQVKAHLGCLKWAGRSIFTIYAMGAILPYVGISFFMAEMTTLDGQKSLLIIILFVPVFFALFYLNSKASDKAKLFFPRKSHSILEELRNRKATNPEDMYNGTAGILGGNVSTTGESLYVVYRRLCTSLISRTQSLDVLLFANTTADDNYSSWVIDWTSEIAHIWGDAIHYMDRRRSMTGRPSQGWNFESTAPTSRRIVLARFGPFQGMIYSTHL